MIHSMIVAIDSTDSSRRAQTFALNLAKQCGASVTGIAVLDTPWIKRPMAMPIGGGSYRTHRDETIIANQSKELDAKIKEFCSLCDGEGVDCRWIEVAGSPSDKLNHEAEQHDLMILGRETNFHGVRGHDVGDATEQLLEDHPRPLIIVPSDEPPTGTDLVVCFDGSIPSSRSMHMVYLLGLAQNRKVHVVSVDEDGDVADGLANRGVAFFKARGIDAEAHGIQEHDDAAHAILHIVESLNACMLVMGAFGEHSMIHQLFSGSVTKQLLRACPVPLFVHY